MSQELNVLESAIMDVGYWSWWTGDFNDALQVEFGGVQLWSPPLAEGKPPNGQIGLLFRNICFAAFLTRSDSDGAPPTNWPEMIARDELGNSSVDQEAFTITNADIARSIYSSATAVDVRAGSPEILNDLRPDDAYLAMWAGNIGIVVVAERLSLVNHAGGIKVDQIAALDNKWWEYWKAYWKSKDTPAPMPRDYACEVTIPIGWE